MGAVAGAHRPEVEGQFDQRIAAAHLARGAPDVGAVQRHQFGFGGIVAGPAQGLGDLFADRRAGGAGRPGAAAFRWPARERVSTLCSRRSTSRSPGALAVCTQAPVFLAHPQHDMVRGQRAIGGVVVAGAQMRAVRAPARHRRLDRRLMRGIDLELEFEFHHGATRETRLHRVPPSLLEFADLHRQIVQLGLAGVVTIEPPFLQDVHGQLKALVVEVVERDAARNWPRIRAPEPAGRGFLQMRRPGPFR